MTAAQPRLRQVRVPVATVWTSPEAPRDVDAEAVRDRPDPAHWASLHDAARLGLHGRTLTQLLLGEPALVLEERAGWSRVTAAEQPSSADRLGYPGWVRSAHLGVPAGGPPAGTAQACVTARSAVCLRDGGAKLPLSFGTRLPVVERREARITVALPGGGHGMLATVDVTVAGPGEPPAFTGTDLLTDAGRFLGLRYLWGGTSSWGVDCSGLVHLVARRRGLRLPRDAFDQAVGPPVRPVPLDAVRPGDLYFFARPGARISHVGFASRPVGADGTRWMLHAPEGGGLVEDAPLAPHRRETLVSAARIVGPQPPARRA